MNTLLPSQQVFSDWLEENKHAMSPAAAGCLLITAHEGSTSHYITHSRYTLQKIVSHVAWDVHMIIAAELCGGESAGVPFAFDQRTKRAVVSGLQSILREVLPKLRVDEIENAWNGPTFRRKITISEFMNWSV